jgi:hypothetical protein
LIAYRIILIVHLMGLAFGMGGATAFDAIFLVGSRRGKVTHELVEVVHTAANLVAGAMVLLVISGIAFFEVGAQPTPKFWAKMVIVGIACLNGVIAHRLVFPLIEAAASSRTGYLHLRPWHARVAATSAAISGVSWSAALILGAWHGLQLGLVPILLAYTGILAVAVLTSSIIIAPRIFVFEPIYRRSTRARAAGVAQSLALAIGYRSFALAGRLGNGSSWPEFDEFEPRTMPTRAPEPGRRPVEDFSPGNRLLPQEHLDIDDRSPWLSSRDWSDYGQDDETASSRH